MRDKLYHLIAGAAGAAAVAVLIVLAGWWGTAAAMVAGAAMLGVAYEVLQWWRQDGEPDPLDAAATGVGGVLLVAGAMWLGWPV